ncbi:hypothetical protein P8452_32594 [Trifolium repens]|nr:hypothetical protein P8452_32594 [Trifolium repens]
MKRKAPKQVFVPVNSGRVQKNVPANMTVVDQNIVNNGNHSREKEIINVEESGTKSPQVKKGDNATYVNNEINLPAAQLEIRQLEPVLTPLSPRTIQLQQDAVLENELNNNLDSEGEDFTNSSSQGSLVKDSQCDDERIRMDIAVTSMPDFDLARQDTSKAS